MVRYFNALPRAGKAIPDISSPEKRLQLAIAVSVLLHAMLLVVHFSSPNNSASRRESKLEVVLVNAKSANRPNDAQVRAQSNLDGGGNTDENRVLASPLPPTVQQKTGDALIETKRKLQEAENRQRQLMVQAKSIPVPASPREARHQPEPTPQIGLDLANSALAMARLEAKIARESEAYNKRPRRNVIGVRAISAVEAQYVEDWRLKVERVGNLNYPEEARGKLYGTLVLTVELNPDGSLKDVEISKSSGQKVLDNAAKRIVRLAAPYGAFPADLRKDTDILVITRTWTFASSDKLRSD